MRFVVSSTLGVIGPNGAGKTTTIRICLARALVNDPKLLLDEAERLCSRLFVLDQWPRDVLHHGGVLVAYAVVSFGVALALTRMRFGQ